MRTSSSPPGNISPRGICSWPCYMAEMYREIGDLARSPELMREVLEIGRRTIPLHPLMIDGLNMYADQMAKRGQIEETERHYLEAMEPGKRRSRINPPDDR